MGLRPRLSAVAASRLVWSPRAGARESNIHSRGNMDRQDEKLLFSLRCPSRSAFGRSRLATNNPVYPVHPCKSGIYSCSTPKPNAASFPTPRRPVQRRPLLTAPGVCPPPARRDAAFAPLRLDCGLRPARRVCPPPARLRAPPSRRLPLKGGVILERLMQASYHSPLEGESQKPSRQAKADAVGGQSPTPQTKADAVGGGRRGPRLMRAATPGRFSAVPKRTTSPKGSHVARA